MQYYTDLLPQGGLKFFSPASALLFNTIDPEINQLQESDRGRYSGHFNNYDDICRKYGFSDYQGDNSQTPIFTGGERFSLGFGMSDYEFHSQSNYEHTVITLDTFALYINKNNPTIMRMEGVSPTQYFKYTSDVSPLSYIFITFEIGRQVQVWVNGVKLVDVPTTASMANDSAIGFTFYGHQTTFISNVVLYNRVLTDEEVGDVFGCFDYGRFAYFLRFEKIMTFIELEDFNRFPMLHMSDNGFRGEVTQRLVGGLNPVEADGVNLQVTESYPALFYASEYAENMMFSFQMKIVSSGGTGDYNIKNSFCGVHIQEDLVPVYKGRQITLTGDRPLVVGTWHTITIEVDKNEYATMYLDWVVNGQPLEYHGENYGFYEGNGQYKKWNAKARRVVKCGNKRKPIDFGAHKSAYMDWDRIRVEPKCNVLPYGKVRGYDSYQLGIQLVDGTALSTDSVLTVLQVSEYIWLRFSTLGSVNITAKAKYAVHNDDRLKEIDGLDVYGSLGINVLNTDMVVAEKNHDFGKFGDACFQVANKYQEFEIKTSGNDYFTKEIVERILFLYKNNKSFNLILVSTDYYEVRIIKDGISLKEVESSGYYEGVIAVRTVL